MARFLKASHIVIALMAILILIGIGLALVYASLPAYLEKHLLPRLAADAGLDEIDLEVRRVGLFGADLARIRIGKASGPGLLLDSVQIDYTPGGLLNKTIQRVTVSGVELNFEYRDGRLKLDEGLSAALGLQPAQAGKRAQKASVALPFKRLMLRQSSIRLKANGRIFSVPFKLDLTPDEGSSDRMTADALFWPRDQLVGATVKTDLEAGRAHIRMTAEAVQLNAFADLAEPLSGLHLGGAVKIEGSLNLALAPFKISGADAIIEWSGGGIQFRKMRIRPALPVGAEKPGWQMKVGTADGKSWNLSADPLLVESEAVLNLSGLAATVLPSPAGLGISGRVAAEPLMLNITGRPAQFLNLAEGPRIDGSFVASIEPAAGWSVTFDGIPSRRRIQLEADAGQLLSDMGPLHISAKGDSSQIAAEYRATMDGLRLQSASMTARAATLTIEGKTTMPAVSPAEQRTEVSVSMSNASGGNDKFQFSGAKAGFYGILQTRAASKLQASGTARFSAAKLTAAESAAEIQNASGNLPLSWPPPKATGKAGQFKIASARFQKWKLTNVSGTIRQTKSGIDMDGRHQNAIIPGLGLNFSGKSRLTGKGSPVINLNVNAERPRSAAPIDLGTLLPNGQGVFLGGRLAARAAVRLDAGGVKGESSLTLTDGLLQASKENFEVSGVQLGIEMPGLPVLRSAPGQQLRFAKAILGDMQIENGVIFFQIEPAPAVLLEKGQFDWSAGRVDMHSTRIFLDRQDYELTLFCDRLNLARLLEQFGAADAEGSGTVSGKIPIRFQNQKWSVADGFLFSSPGEGGQIRVQGTEILTAGVPKNSPQYMQLEIAREALKDYNFDWAKLTVSTEGEDMLLKLQLDGKPARTLPFAFSKDIGSFARVEGQAKGSTFQGIRLDVNFRLPLNKILQYKSIIQMLRK